MKPEQLQALEHKIQDYRRQLKELLQAENPTPQEEQRIKAITQELARLQESYERLRALSDSSKKTHDASQAAPQPPSAKGEGSWDQLVVRKVFAFAGIILFVLGLLLLLAYAIDHGWLTPPVRIALGYLGAAAMLGTGIKQRPLGTRWASVWVAGAAVLSFVTSLYTVNHYELNHWGGIALLVGNMLIFLVYAYYYREELIGILGFVGGYLVLVPLRGLDADSFLIFTYIGILNTGISLLALRFFWWRTVLLSFLTAGLFLFIWVILEAAFGANAATTNHQMSIITLWYGFLYHAVLLFLLYRHAREKLSVFLWFLLANIGLTFILMLNIYDGIWAIPAAFALFAGLHEPLRRLLPPPRDLSFSITVVFRLLAALFAIGTLQTFMLPKFESGEIIRIENDFVRLFPWSSIYLFGVAALYFAPHRHTTTYWKVIYYITGGVFFLLPGMWNIIQFEESAVLWWQLLSRWLVLVCMAWLYRRLLQTGSREHNILTVFFLFLFWFTTIEFINYAFFVHEYDLFTLPAVFCFSVVYYLAATYWAKKQSGLSLPAAVRYGVVPALAAFSFIACLASFESIMWHVFLKGYSPYSWLWRYAVYACLLGLLYHQRRQLQQGNSPKVYVRGNFYARQISWLLICSMEAIGFYMIVTAPHDKTSYQLHLDLSLRFVLSLSWLLLAGFWIYRGIRRQHLDRRRLGVLLALLSILKILIIDVQAESPLSRIILFIVAGAVLLVASYLYQRYKDFLTDENKQAPNGQ
ncbi:MAG: hypothetical protein KatS3mg033_2216 [Thermonema sp.]|uniref:DUF2339 domain-containing protein n=1 Tax=Thermonema sp. TaxID=2231181 RepID=UPI0021DEFE90|nr:DUF2339 domain-containing protein [Thermonema sp.]GIV40416.1 MAG: hypothetical protein KatS3mg033_2216 [Thermonema sp.]